MSIAANRDLAVVCPTYNSEAYLLATLQSVEQQTAPPAEVIISDDGSTDGTVPLARAFFERSTMQGRVLVNQHRGPGATRNSGVKATARKWIAFIDSDDIWLPHKIERVCAEIESHLDKNFFCHAEEHHTRTGRKSVLDYGAWYKPDRPLPAQLMRQNLFSTSAVVCTRGLLAEAGLFDETLGSSQDYEMWLRMSPHIRVFFIRETLGYYVDRPGNITSRNPLWRLRNLLRVFYRHRQKTDIRSYSLAVARSVAVYGILSVKQRFTRGDR